MKLEELSCSQLMDRVRFHYRLNMWLAVAAAFTGTVSPWFANSQTGIFLSAGTWMFIVALHTTWARRAKILLRAVSDYHEKHHVEN